MLLGFLAALPHPAWAEAVASGWRVGVRDGGITRFVLDVSEPVAVRVQPRGPERVFIDLTGVTLRLEDKPPRGGLIQRAVTVLDAAGAAGSSSCSVARHKSRPPACFRRKGRSVTGWWSIWCRARLRR
ncbi:AMIN domain-containing protein [Elstera litoralis]|uniref:AMIN domain-containing protein n=1 Tax=Elstera litoralis TaxID=552518 RepID=UPI001E49523E|nr:AMIN domain-containing protein [Elstera litoralis]